MWKIYARNNANGKKTTTKRSIDIYCNRGTATIASEEKKTTATLCAFRKRSIKRFTQTDRSTRIKCIILCNIIYKLCIEYLSFAQCNCVCHNFFFVSFCFAFASFVPIWSNIHTHKMKITIITRDFAMQPNAQRQHQLQQRQRQCRENLNRQGKNEEEEEIIVVHFCARSHLATSVHGNEDVASTQRPCTQNRESTRKKVFCL